MDELDNGLSGGIAASNPTLAELAEKLSELREHLGQVVAELNAPPEENGSRLGATTAAGRRLGNSTTADGRLRCRECARTGSEDAAGWTLRLCADDELHAFCPDCDQRYFNGGGGSGTP